MTDRRETFVVVGGGQAGGRAVEAMRDAGFAGSIVLFGAERERPYERPPLSKQMLTGEGTIESAFLRPRAFYDEHGVDLRLSTEVLAIDRRAARVELSDGKTLAYDKLLIATGSRARLLDVPGAGLAGVHTLRDVDDSRAIAAAIETGSRFVVVGGGYVGLEVAAAARKRGCAVTVVEAADSLMRRQIAPELGAWYAELHRARGVRVLTGAGVAEFLGREQVEAVELSDGTRLPADAVVVGVGAEPNVELARDAGLVVDGGIVVDSHARSDDPAIFAAGDVANHPNPLLGRRLRLESWQNAQNQALTAGRAMAGTWEAYAQVPWFWSDQYEMNL